MAIILDISVVQAIAVVREEECQELALLTSSAYKKPHLHHYTSLATPSMIPAPRLACEQCKRRKIRCNKGSPCSACKNADLHCHTVQRARLARGKSGKARRQNKVLEDRVARIESLLARQTEPRSGSCSTSSSNHISTLSTGLATGSDNVASLLHTGATPASFVAPDFWTVLSQEVHGLREILEESGEDDEEEISISSVPEKVPAMLGTGMALFPYFDHGVKKTTPVIAPEMRTKLLQIYRTRVDSVYKILHWPTVLLMIGASHERNAGTFPILSVQVLEHSIYFMAICSLATDESEDMGFAERLDMLQNYRSAIEGMLAKSGLLHCPDLAVLQAFVIYLVRVIGVELSITSRCVL
jgi:hypothetical protein